MAGNRCSDAAKTGRRVEQSDGYRRRRAQLWCSVNVEDGSGVDGLRADVCCCARAVLAGQLQLRGLWSAVQEVEL